MIRVIDHKKIDLTNDEWNVYQDILKAYDPKLRPEKFFHDLFETDENGIIIFLKPPKSNYSTMEVVIFLQNICLQQHLREMYKKVDQVVKEVQDLKKI